MRPFMIVAKVGNITFARFVDTYAEAKSMATDIECGLGGYTEIYARETAEDGPEYRLLES